MSEGARAFFDAIARRYDRVYARSGAEAKARLARVMAELAPESHVLDLGVGTGRELPALLDAGQMLAVCAARSRPIPLVLGDFWRELPWKDETFDAVLALHGTLAHAPGEAALGGLAREVRRVLRRGGVFVAEVPTEAWFREQATGPSVDWLGGGRVRFVDEVSSASVEAWATTEQGWASLFAGELAMRTEPGLPGEVVLVGRRER